VTFCSVSAHRHILRTSHILTHFIYMSSSFFLQLSFIARFEVLPPSLRKTEPTEERNASKRRSIFPSCHSVHSEDSNFIPFVSQLSKSTRLISPILYNCRLYLSKILDVFRFSKTSSQYIYILNLSALRDQNDTKLWFGVRRILKIKYKR
jgi:hypothetical protein